VEACLLLVSFASSNSGETYCAVPTNVLVARPAGTNDEGFSLAIEARKDGRGTSINLPVPKSVTLIRNSSSSSRFSGLRSLEVRSAGEERGSARHMRTDE